MLFASAGYSVSIYDIDPQQVENALKDILAQLNELKKIGLLRGNLTVEEQHNLIRGSTDISSTVSGAIYVQVITSMFV